MKNFVWIALFKFLIDFVYVTSISEKFDTFDLRLNITRYLVSWLLLTITFTLVNKVNDRAKARTSTLLLFLIYLFSYVPGVSLWALNDLDNSFFLFFNIYWILIFIVMYFYSKAKIPSLNRLDIGEKKKYIFMVIFLLSVGFGLYFSYVYSGFRVHLDLLSVYDLRDTGADASTLERLLYYIVSTVLYPLFAIYYYKQKNWLLFLVSVFMELLMFSVQGHKFYFFIIPVGIVAFHVYSDKFFENIPKYVNGLIFLGIIEKISIQSEYIFSYFVRRIMFVPALLDSLYFDFFTTNQPIYFAQDKILSRLGLVSPYPMSVSRVIGEVYMNGSNANTGLFGDAISNLGNYAVFVYPFIFLLAVFLLDLLTNNIPQKYYMTVLVSIVMVLLNNEISGIFYNFILPMIFLFIFIDYNSNKNDNGDSGGDHQIKGDRI